VRNRLLALLAVLTVSLVGCSSQQAGPKPRPTATAIPSSFPLAAGTRDPTRAISVQRGVGIDPGFAPWIETSLRECGRHLTWVTSRTSVAAVSVPSTAQGVPPDQRTLAVFATEPEAKAHLSAIAHLAPACSGRPPRSPRAPGQIGLSGNAGVFLESEAGDASYAWTTPDSTVLHLAVRIGRAILLERTTQTTATPEQSIAAAELRLQPVLVAMCAYAEGSCRHRAQSTGSAS